MQAFLHERPIFFPSEPPATPKGRQAAIFSPVLANEMIFDYSAPLPALPRSGLVSGSLYAGQCEGFIPNAPTAGGGVPDLSPAGSFPFVETTFKFPDAPQGFNTPPSPVLPPITHFYWRLENTAQVEQHLELSRMQGKIQFRCTFQDCTGDVFMMKRKAYVHLGIEKHYECACGVQFACLASAKRHLVTRCKTFGCKHCPQQFARKDYRALHQKRCGEHAHAKSLNLRKL